ncbi:MAG: DUF6364 family protein [Spirochaetaceae bacterium]|nr:DUF6364 family protein [Spirochaetaceae bacterium]
MNQKLTLSLDSSVVDFAHVFSKKYHKSISKIVENYFIELKEQNITDIPEDLEELYGIFEGMDAPNKKELRKIFHEKNSN